MYRSTRRNCPCSEEERRPDGGGIELCSACSSVKHGTSTVSSLAARGLAVTGHCPFACRNKQKIAHFMY